MMNFQGGWIETSPGLCYGMVERGKSEGEGEAAMRGTKGEREEKRKKKKKKPFCVFQNQQCV